MLMLSRFSKLFTLLVSLSAIIASISIIYMSDSESSTASPIIVKDELQHPLEPQSDTVPSITVEPDHTYGDDQFGWVLEREQEAPFILIRSDATAGTLTVDIRVSQDRSGYVAPENIGLKSVTLEFGADGTARLRDPDADQESPSQWRDRCRYLGR